MFPETFSDGLQGNWEDAWRQSDPELVASIPPPQQRKVAV